jgi:L-amino acid N-acyltransferase YncA
MSRAPTPGYVIVAMQRSDWEQVRAVYLEGIHTGDATFETNAPPWEQWNAAHMRQPRLVARCGEAVLGWAALSPVSSRCVYAGVAEVSIYVRQDSRGQGIGRALLERLVAESEQEGIWTLQAGVLPENTASLRLHRSLGFREVGRRERLGKMKGAWRDVVLLERRSSVAGMN